EDLPAFTAHFLADARRAAELHARGAPGLGRGHTARGLLRRGFLEEVGDLVLGVAARRVAMEERVEASREAPKHAYASLLRRRATAAARRAQSAVSTSRRFRPLRVRL